MEGAADVNRIGVNIEGGGVCGEEDPACCESNGEGDSKGRLSGHY